MCVVSAQPDKQANEIKNRADNYIGITLLDKDNNNVPGWKKSNIFLENNIKFSLVVLEHLYLFEPLIQMVLFLHLINFSNF